MESISARRESGRDTSTEDLLGSTKAQCASRFQTFLSRWDAPHRGFLLGRSWHALQGLSACGLCSGCLSVCFCFFFSRLRFIDVSGCGHCRFRDVQRAGTRTAHSGLWRRSRIGLVSASSVPPAAQTLSYGMNRPRAQTYPRRCRASSYSGRSHGAVGVR